MKPISLEFLTNRFLIKKYAPLFTKKTEFVRDSEMKTPCTDLSAVIIRFTLGASLT